MSEAELAARLQMVQGLGLGLALLLGMLLQRARVCAMGAVSDVLAFGDWDRARLWALALAVAMLGFQLGVGLGWIRAEQTAYAAARLPWLAQALGGLMFGIGMVLAGGCGARHCVRLGGGSLKSLVVLLVMALAAAATLRGVLLEPRLALVEAASLRLTTAQDLPTLLAGPDAAARWAPWLGLGLALPLAVCALWRGRRTEVWLGGLLLGLAVLALWWLSARYAFVAEHPETLEPAFVGTSANRPESYSFVGPLAAWLELALGAKGLRLGALSVLGVVLGSAVSALLRREFQWEGFRQTADLARHLLGAMLMGAGGVLALGCTFGQGLSGLSTLSLGSLISSAGIVAGAVLAWKLLAWRAEHAG